MNKRFINTKEDCISMYLRDVRKHDVLTIGFTSISIYPFSVWNDSFYGDLHMQGKEGVQFYTRQKVILSRWDNLYEYKSGW